MTLGERDNRPWEIFRVLVIEKYMLINMHKIDVVNGMNKEYKHHRHRATP